MTKNTLEKLINRIRILLIIISIVCVVAWAFIPSGRKIFPGWIFSTTFGTVLLHAIVKWILKMKKRSRPLRWDDVLRSIMALIALAIFAGSVILTIACWEWLEIGKLGGKSISTMSQIWVSPLIFINYVTTITLLAGIVSVARRGDKKSLANITGSSVLGTAIYVMSGLLVGAIIGIIGGFFSGVIFKAPNWLVYGSVLGAITGNLCGFILGTGWVLITGFTDGLEGFYVKEAWR